MKNASSDITASNILFTFEPEAVENSPVFTTANGSNSVVVNSLAPGASEVLTMKFTSSPSAEQRAYNITITEQYDSPEFKNAKETVKIAVALKQEARLNTGHRGHARFHRGGDRDKHHVPHQQHGKGDPLVM